MTNRVSAGFKAWQYAKIWSRLRDFPEVSILAVLGTTVLGMGLHTIRRQYTSPAVDSYPDVEVRKDMWKQLEVDENNEAEPSWFYKVASLKVDRKGYNIGVFDNRARPFEYNRATQKEESHIGPHPDLMNYVYHKA